MSRKSSSLILTRSLPAYGRIKNSRPHGAYRTFSITVDGKEILVSLSFTSQFLPVLTFGSRSFYMSIDNLIDLAGDNGLFLPEFLNSYTAKGEVSNE